MPLTVSPLPFRLSLCRGRSGRVDHGPGLGRPGLGVRERQYFGRDRTIPVADQAAIADIDLDMLAQERLQMGRSIPTAAATLVRIDGLEFRCDPPRDTDVGFRRRIERFPFVPADVARLEQDCYEAYNIQVSGLAQRLRATGLKRVVIGISGGLDFDAGAAGVCSGLRSSRAAARRHPCLHDAGLRDLGPYEIQCLEADAVAGGNTARARHQAGGKTDAGRSGTSLLRGQAGLRHTFENVQAGLRTDYLFRLANHHGGIVIGTGDSPSSRLAGAPMASAIRWRITTSMPGCRRR